jgi:hypothetical protein
MAAILQIRRGTGSVSLTDGELYLNKTTQSLQIGSNEGIISLAKLNSVNSGSFNVSGDITLGGTITIGDNTSDNLVVNADLSSSIIPNNDNSFDLGSTSFRYRAIYGTNVYGAINATNGVVSGSAQITPLLPTGVVSGSSQISYTGLSNIPSGIVSGSTQITPLLPTGVISGSSQLSGTTITNLTVVNLTAINETASVIFSSGSNIFGDAGNDIHSFTGSVKISGSLTTIGSSTATSYNGIINATNGVVSGSSQITYTNISSIPSGIISGSTQVTQLLPTGVVSGSSQIIANLPAGTVSGSVQIVGILASLNSYTSSQDTKNTSLATITGSLITSASTTETKFLSIASQSGSWGGGGGTNLHSGSTGDYQFNSIGVGTAATPTIAKGNFNGKVILQSGINTAVGSQGLIFSYPGLTNNLTHSIWSGHDSSVQNYNKLDFYISKTDGTTKNVLSLRSSQPSVIGLDTGLGLDINGNLNVTGSINSTTTTLISGSAQVIGILSSLNTYTGSNDTTNTAQNNRLTSIESVTGSYETKGRGIISSSVQVLGGSGVLSGSSSTPVGTISGSAQITSLGFVSSSVTASSLITASVNVNVITFTKGDASTFSLTIAASGSVTPGTISGSGQIITLGFLQTSSFQTYTGSVDIKDIATGASTSSLNSFTSSQITINTGYNTFTASNANTSLNSFTSSIAPRLTNLETTSASVNISISSLNTFTASQSTASLVTSITNLNTFTSSQLTINSAIGASTSSLNLFTASAALRLTNLETTTASLNISAAALNSFSASENTKASTLATYTGSIDTKFTTLATYTGSIDTKFVSVGVSTSSLNSFTSSATPRLTNLETTSASVNISVTNLNTFTASNANTSLNTYTSSISDPTFVQIGASTSSLNLFTASAAIRLTNLETTTASLNISVSNLNTYSASVSNSIQQLSVFTGSQETKNLTIAGLTGSFATTGSNIFNGSQTITGSGDLYIIGSSSALLRVHASTNTTPIADIELMRGTNTTWGADASGDYRFRNSGGDLSIQYGDTGVTNTRFTIASTGNVGIGTTSPSSKLHINFGSDFDGLRLQNSTRGHNYLLSTSGVTAQSFVIYDVDNATNLATFGNDTSTLYTSGSARLTIASTGNVGIGDTSPSFKLDISGSGRFRSDVQISGSLSVVGDVVAYSTSDERLKENIQPIQNALNKVESISGNTYDWKDGFNEIHPYTGHDVGVIAQELEKVLPEGVIERDNGYKAVNYEKIVPLLIQAIKELNEKIKQLESK